MHKRSFFVFAIVTAIVLSLLGGNAYAGPTLKTAASVNLAVEQTAFTATEGVTVRVDISNPTNQPLNLLRWYTLVNGLEEPLFIVTRDGEPVKYIGALYRRPEPTAADYITLEPGASVESSVDLAMFYDFSVSGTYTIAYDVAALYTHTLVNEGDDLANIDDAATIAALASNNLNLQVEGRAKWTPPQAGAQVSGGVASISFVSCSSSRQSSTKSAHSAAQSYAVNSVNYLQSGRQGSRYTTWFGSYNSSRYNTVRRNYIEIRDALGTAPVTYHCTCTGNYFAYVYPDYPYDIYLCNAFWSAPTTGNSSKADTIIHEISHFNVVASTDDWVYGQTGCKDLARTNPSRAINNADNYSFFSVNSPALP